MKTMKLRGKLARVAQQKPNQTFEWVTSHGGYYFGGKTLAETVRLLLRATREERHALIQIISPEGQRIWFRKGCWVH